MAFHNLNKAVYKTTSVAYGWAGAVTQIFQLHGKRMDGPTDTDVREGTYGMYAYVPGVGLRIVSD